MTARRRIVESEDVARKIVQTFKDRPVEYTENMSFSWPDELQNVGDSLAVAYSSDKWKPKNSAGKRQQELFKHLAESRNRAYLVPGLLHDYHRQSRLWPVRGPMFDFASCPMPRHFAILGLFEEIDLQLYTGGDDENPRFDNKGDSIVKVTVRHGMLGGAEIRWSEESPMEPDEPFLFVYTKGAGVLMIVTGDDLDIEKDGIVG